MRSAVPRSPGTAPSPKIELHVHLEGTVRARTLLEIARRNEVALPAQSVEELEAIYRFRDFAHFIEVWVMTTSALRREADFRQVVVDYAEEAAEHGALYIEAIFAPGDAVARGSSWEEVFEGYCSGAQQAREKHGVEVALTPDISRGCAAESAEELALWAVRHRDRGVVGLGLGGLEAQFGPEPYARAFAIGREGGLASVPHAGEVAGVESIRGALEALGADRIRHGIRAIEDGGLVAELAGRRTVLDVCPISNLRTGAVASLAKHPLSQLVEAGVLCSLSTDDPAMFDTDLSREHEAARAMGLPERGFYEAGVEGALCSEERRAELERIGAAFAWEEARRGSDSLGDQ